MEEKYDLHQKITYMAAELSQAQTVAAAQRLKVTDMTNQAALMKRQYNDKIRKHREMLKQPSGATEQQLRDTEYKLTEAQVHILS